MNRHARRRCCWLQGWNETENNASLIAEPGNASHESTELDGNLSEWNLSFKVRQDTLLQLASVESLVYPLLKAAREQALFQMLECLGLISI